MIALTVSMLIYLKVTIIIIMIIMMIVPLCFQHAERAIKGPNQLIAHVVLDNSCNYYDPLRRNKRKIMMIIMC